MFLQSHRKQSQPGPVAYYEFQIQEVRSTPSQKMIVTEQNSQNYISLRISTANPNILKNRIKTLPRIKRDKIIPFPNDYNTAYRTMFSQRNLMKLIGGPKK